MEGTVRLFRIKLEELINQYYSISSKFIDPIRFLSDLINILIKARGKVLRI